MSYVSKNQLINKYGEPVLIALTDRAGAGLIDDTVLNSALAEADALINGYIGSRYTLPLTTVPESITSVAFAIVRYQLDGDNGNADVRNRYLDAVKFLGDVSSGKAVLTDVAAVTPVAPPANSIAIQSGGSVFGRDVR